MDSGNEEIGQRHVRMHTPWGYAYMHRIIGSRRRQNHPLVTIIAIGYFSKRERGLSDLEIGLASPFNVLVYLATRKHNIKETSQHNHVANACDEPS